MRQSKLTPKRKEQIIELLSKGATDRDVCAAVGIDESTFYRWLQDGREGKDASKSEFCESVTRARAQANLVAIDAMRVAMQPNEIVTDTTETFTETRIGKDGEPYEYHRTTSKKSVVHQGGDWRAGVEYLKRRDPEHWTEHVVISFSPEALIAMRQLGIDPVEAVKQFERMALEAAAARLINDSAQ